MIQLIRMAVEQRENRLQLRRRIVASVHQWRRMGKQGRFRACTQSLWPWWSGASSGGGIKLRRRRIRRGSLETWGRMRNGERTGLWPAVLAGIVIARGCAKDRQERANWNVEAQGVNYDPNAPGMRLGKLPDSPRERPIVTESNHHDRKDVE